MSARDGAVSVTDKYGEPIHRQPRYPQPDPTPVIRAARQRRQAFLAALHPWTQSTITEHEREARQDADEEQFMLDTDESRE